MFSCVFFDVRFCWGVLLVGRLGCISNWKYAGLHPPFCWIRIQFGKTPNLLGMVIPSQGWYEVWANRLTFSKLEKNMCWNSWSIYQLLQDVDQQYIHVICAFWFLRGVGCLKVNGQLVKSPFYIPYSSVCLVFVCLVVFSLSFCFSKFVHSPIFPNYPCEFVFGKFKRFISHNWLCHPSCFILHTSMSMSTQYTRRGQWPGWCRRSR